MLHLKFAPDQLVICYYTVKILTIAKVSNFKSEMVDAGNSTVEFNLFYPVAQYIIY